MMNDRVRQQSGQIHLSMENSRIYLSPGSRITISIGLTNLDSEEDVFALAITSLPEEFVTLETPQIRLAPGEYRKVDLEIQLPDDTVFQAGVYPFEVLAKSRNRPGGGAVADGHLIVPAYTSEGRTGLIVPATRFSVAPGSRVDVTLVLINRGLKPDAFQLRVEGIPTGWISTPSAITWLEPGAQQEVEFSIQPPRSSESLAGRHPFTVLLTGKEIPGQDSSVDCILTVTAYTAFHSEIQPVELDTEQSARVIVINEGNVQDSYNISLHSQGDVLRYEEISRQVTGIPEQSQNIPPEVDDQPTLRIPAGETGVFEFRTWPRSRPILGGVKVFPFIARVESMGNLTQTLQGSLHIKPLIPVWMLPVAAMFLLVSLCSVIFIFNPFRPQGPSATQTALAVAEQIASATGTAAFDKTQIAIIGQEDPDGDGLTNLREIELGTDPTNPDTDRDELRDGDEINPHDTDPLNPDTDGDGLSDGEEVLRRGTDPVLSDSDRDGLSDGDEVQRGLDPVNQDTDRDGLNDGEELNRGTNPVNPDSDSDGLPDGQETPPCPNPLNPDSDTDGIIDGRDSEPCDPNNLSLTATAGNPVATQTPPPTTQIPPSPTAPAVILTSQPLPPNGLLAFESNRDGNPEIYRLNLGNQTATRLTTDAGTDTQPAWSSDGSRIAFVSNRDGNSEIYIMNADGTVLRNVTNNPSEDTDPAWSPDGDQIAFTTNRDGNNEIYIVNTDGSDPFNLSNNPADDSQPSWFFQPALLVLSEERIAFTSNRDGNQEIYSMTPDGSGQTNLTQHPANDYSAAGYQDARQIAFVSDRDGNQEIYLMNTDGSSPKNLTNHPAGDLQPAWLGNGEWLSFVTDRDGNLEIYLVRNDGSSLERVTQNPARDDTPALYTR